MGEVLLAGLDLAFAMIRRYSVIYLLCGVLSAEDGWTKSKKRVSAGFMAVTTVFYLICSYLPAAQRLLYGNREGMQASRASILPMALSLALMLAYCCFFYPGKKNPSSSRDAFSPDRPHNPSRFPATEPRNIPDQRRSACHTPDPGTTGAHEPDRACRRIIPSVLPPGAA